MPGTLIIDTGTNAVGIYSVADGVYTHYCGQTLAELAVPLIQDAEELVTFSGRNRDLPDLARFAGLPAGAVLPLSGKHTDMLSLCWDNSRMFGKSLVECYRIQFGEPPSFPENTYEQNIERDVRMTLKLWQAWKQGELPHSPKAESAA